MNDQPVVLSIGNFDGVHLGHQALMAEARRLADARGGRVVALSFDEHPQAVLHPGDGPGILMHPDQKVAALRAAGADAVEWLEADASLLVEPPDEFVNYLVDRFRPVVGLAEGLDFRFGHGRTGDVRTLSVLGKRYGFEVVVVPEVAMVLGDKVQRRVSSTLLRMLLHGGRVADVHRCMGSAYELLGTVVRGEQRGRVIGFATANLDIAGQLLPADGVYAGRATLGDASYAAAVSIGIKPTFAGAPRTCEVHLLDYSGEPLYDRRLTVSLCRWLREQYRFPTVDGLLDQIRRDIHRIRHYDARDLFCPVCSIGRFAG